MRRGEAAIEHGLEDPWLPRGGEEAAGSGGEEWGGGGFACYDAISSRRPGIQKPFLLAPPRWSGNSKTQIIVKPGSTVPNCQRGEADVMLLPSPSLVDAVTLHQVPLLLHT